jgi:hypothetical protein
MHQSGYEVERLQRELAHVDEQCRVAHALAMSFRQRALAAEEACRRWEQKYRNLKRRKGLEHEAEALDETQDVDAVLLLA